MTTQRPQRYDLIVFDWDGTLFDSTALIVQAIQGAAADLGLPVPPAERAAHVIGLGLYEALAIATPELPRERYAEMGQAYRKHYFAQHEALCLFAGVEPLLQALKARHHWLAIATGKSRSGLNEALRHVALHGVFDASRTADETQSKPHPLMLEELMREFGVEPERTLMIGDTTHDLQLARNAGCAALGVGYGAHDPEQFEAYETVHIAHSVPELQDWLLKHA